MESKRIYPTNVDYIEKQVYVNGLLQPMPSSFYKGIKQNDFDYFVLKNAIYVVPTTELIEFLKKNIVGKAIEIGSGVGTIGRALEIPTTDNRMQERQEIVMYYLMCGQPVIKYPNDIEKLESNDAIKKYKPDTVVGAFITHKFDNTTQTGNAFSVDEKYLLNNVQRYINIGNLSTHRDKPILKSKPQSHNFTEIYEDWLICRVGNQSLNRIWIFDKK